VLFDRFSQVKNTAREYGGSGLGLVISKVECFYSRDPILAGEADP